MVQHRNSLSLIVLWMAAMGLVCGVVFGAAGTGFAASDLDSRVVLEGGLIRPLGELGADFDEALLGLGAGRAYELGFRFRLPVTSNLSLSPGFHFVDFKSHVLTDDAEEEFPTEAFSYRFTLEAMVSTRFGGDAVRPFLAVAGGLYRNRVVGFYDDPFAEERNHSVNTFGYSIRWGVAVNQIELSFVAHRNTVESWHLFPAETKTSYSWNQIGARLGYLLPW